MKNIKKTFAKLIHVSALGANWSDRIKLAALFLYFSVCRRLGLSTSTRKFKMVTFGVGGQKLPFYLKNQLDFDVICIYPAKRVGE